MNERQFREWLRAANVRMSNKGRVFDKKDLVVINLIRQGKEKGRRVEGIGLERLKFGEIKGERELGIEAMEENRNNEKGRLEGQERNGAREELFVDRDDMSKIIYVGTNNNRGNERVQGVIDDAVMSGDEAVERDRSEH